MIVCKFGGSSLADASQFRKVYDIVKSNPDRHYVVPSAPGRRFGSDEKVTDLLYSCQRTAAAGADFSGILLRIRERYDAIIRDLGLSLSLNGEFDTIARDIRAGAGSEYCASRGEYLNGILLAAYLGFDFVDAARVVRFNAGGALLEDETLHLMSEEMKKHQWAVIPGFYGADEQGVVRTFSRGGSDISGALAASSVNADVYENWTDVPGFCMADPRIVPDAKYISSITYRELRELSYMGATVLHEDAVFPVRKCGIPTNIRSTNDPHHPGTMISVSAGLDGVQHTITGIAGQKGFSIIHIEKDMMNSELGFGRRVLQAFEENGVNFEHLPTGIDTMSVVVRESELNRRRDEVIARIEELVHPDQITVADNIALIATVGRGMVRMFGTAARLFTAISSRGISIRTIDQGSSEISIIVGVDAADFNAAIEAIYDAFVRT